MSKITLPHIVLYSDLEDELNCLGDNLLNDLLEYEVTPDGLCPTDKKNKTGKHPLSGIRVF